MNESEESKEVVAVPLPSGLKNRALKVPAGTHVPEAPAHLFKLHTMCAFVGTRGSGKTNACVVLAKEYFDYGSFTRIYLISPTYESNTVFQMLDIRPEDIYQDTFKCQDALHDIINKIQQDKQMYDQMQSYSKVYKQWKKSPNTLSAEEMFVMEDMDYAEPLDLPIPSSLLIIDDMSHSDIFSGARKNPFINLCLRHRHLHKVGLSIFMLLQNYRSHGSIPKALRENIQQFFVWKVRDMSVLRAIHGEFANLIAFDEFQALFNHATSENDHDFMTIDMNAHDKILMFRKNFDEVLRVSH